MFGKTVYRKEVPKASGAEALWGQRKLGSLLIRALTYGILSSIFSRHKKEGQKDVEAQLQAQLVCGRGKNFG